MLVSFLPGSQLVFCLFEFVFHVRPLYFLQSIWGQTCYGWINHDIVEDLCSKLLVSLSSYIHLGLGKNILSCVGIEPWSFESWVVYFTPRLKRYANGNVSCLYICILYGKIGSTNKVWKYTWWTCYGQKRVLVIRQRNAADSSLFYYIHATLFVRLFLRPTIIIFAV